MIVFNRPYSLFYARLYPPSQPELAIAVTPAHIGRGMGGLMLARLLGDAAAIHSAIVLSVRANNPAKALYERLGFTTVAEITNRVGSTSFIMKVALTSSR
jgi:ribosomal protein S18 acetylase RimI-like enzyme